MPAVIQLQNPDIVKGIFSKLLFYAGRLARITILPSKLTWRSHGRVHAGGTIT